MQASTQKKEYVAIPADGKTEKTRMTKMPSTGTVIKAGLITAGAIAAGITIVYYLRKRNSSSRT